MALKTRSWRGRGLARIGVFDVELRRCEKVFVEQAFRIEIAARRRDEYKHFGWLPVAEIRQYFDRLGAEAELAMPIRGGFVARAAEEIDEALVRSGIPSDRARARLRIRDARAVELLELQHAYPKTDVPDRILRMLTNRFFICGLRRAPFPGARQHVPEIVQPSEVRRRDRKQCEIGFTRVVVAAEYFEELRAREQILDRVWRARQTRFDLGKFSLGVSR